jgi:hypothetical protein
MDPPGSFGNRSRTGKPHYFPETDQCPIGRSHGTPGHIYFNLGTGCGRNTSIRVLRLCGSLCRSTIRIGQKPGSSESPWWDTGYYRRCSIQHNDERPRDRSGQRGNQSSLYSWLTLGTCDFTNPTTESYRYSFLFGLFRQFWKLKRNWFPGQRF